MTDNVLGLGDHLLSRIILDGDKTAFKQIVSDELSEEERAYYNFINNHLARYDVLPDSEVIITDTNYNFSRDVIQPPNYYLDRISERFKTNEGLSLVDDYSQLVVAGDLQGATELLRARSSAIINSGGTNDIVDIETLARQTLQKQRDKQLGRCESGLLTGYAGLDADLMGLSMGDMLIICGRIKMGKASCVDAPILMRNGSWKRMGDIHVGDSLASIDGEESIVQAVYPQGECDLYEVNFSDGRSTKVTLDHLWEIDSHHFKEPKVVSTKELIEYMGKRRYQKNLYVDTVSGDFGSDDQLPIDPWLLGFLLGDGCFRGNQIAFSNSEPDNIQKVVHISGCGISYDSGCDYRLTKSADLLQSLKDLGLWGTYSTNKFIPDCYMKSNRKNRLALMQGLLDSDGCVEQSACVTIQLTNEKLMSQFQQLIWSMGGVSKMQNRVTASGKVAYRTVVRHSNTRQFVSSDKHLARYESNSKGRFKIPRNRVESVNIVGRGDAQCISVSHPRQLYITDDYIVTHNTYIALNMALNAWRNGAKLLVVTMEMSPIQLADRIQSMIAGFNPRALRSEMISSHLYRRMEDQIRGFDDMPPMNFLAGNFRKTPSDIARAAARYQPDLILIDGAYLVSPNDRNTRTAKHEVLGEVIGDIKSLSEDNGCVTLPTVQLNRNAAGSAKGKKAMDGDALSVENVAGTDSYSATTTTMVAVGGVQNASDKRRLKQLISRESEGDYDAIIKFEFSPPNFDELCTYAEYAEYEEARELESRRQTAEHFGL